MSRRLGMPDVSALIMVESSSGRAGGEADGGLGRD